uniref:Secreted protein n=1 Tax=Macrostomum lignano TaxID=282301 RepID=A0A1I8F5E7_9PLAT
NHSNAALTHRETASVSSHKRVRTAFSSDQLLSLETEFSVSMYLTRIRRNWHCSAIESERVRYKKETQLLSPAGEKREVGSSCSKCRRLRTCNKRLLDHR